MKHCYIRFNEDFHVLHDNRYIGVFLCENSDGKLMCGLNGRNNWELSYTGPDAEDKFNALLDVCDEVSYDYILQLGFTQYG
jgi:hypothetical protein